MPYIQDCIATTAPARGAKHVIRVWLSALIAVLAFLMLSSAVAADAKRSGAKTKTKPSASQEERAACMNANVDRAACLREIGAARQEAKRGGLTEPDADFRQNALRRCEVFTIQDERKACERRALGDGSMSGSVEEGGLLRQTTTVEVIQPSTPSSGSQPSMQPGSSQGMPSGRMSSDTMQPGMTQPARR